MLGIVNCVNVVLKYMRIVNGAFILELSFARYGQSHRSSQVKFRLLHERLERLGRSQLIPVRYSQGPPFPASVTPG